MCVKLIDYYGSVVTYEWKETLRWCWIVAVLSGAQAAQTGKIFKGPGAAKADLPELNSNQEECLRKAKKYALEQNVKITAVRQTIVQQQQVNFKFYKYPNNDIINPLTQQLLLIYHRTL